MSDGALPPIRELVPHGPPMLLLDRVIARAGDGIVCGATVPRDSVFAIDGHVPASLCLEYIAQGCAAAMGLWGRERGEAVRPGYLLACRQLELQVDVLEPGDHLEVHVARVSSAGAAASFDGYVVRSGDTIARGSVSVIRSESVGESEGAS